LYVKIFLLTVFCIFMEKNSEALLSRVERINHLMDIYGDLLTEKQRSFVNLHYGEDLSFGEIAAQYNVSRQAIYDAVKHALANLERIESSLALMDLPLKEKSADQDNSEKIEDSSLLKIKESIDIATHLKHRVQKQSIIYNIDWIVNDLKRIISNMEACCKEEGCQAGPE
jgi:uncharacterized protein